MAESRLVEHAALSSSNPAQTAAEKIVRDAETREGRSPRGDGHSVHETTSTYLGMKRKEAPSAGDNMLPPSTSETLGRDAETLSPGSDHSEPLHEATSSYLGMTRKETPAIADETPVAHAEPGGSAVPAGDDPAPFSSALGIPTLLNEDSSKPSSAPREDNPAPFSSALHIPTLIHESKPSSER